MIDRVDDLAHGVGHPEERLECAPESDEKVEAVAREERLKALFDKLTFHLNAVPNALERYRRTGRVD